MEDALLQPLHCFSFFLTILTRRTVSQFLPLFSSHIEPFISSVNVSEAVLFSIRNFDFR